MEGTQPLYPGQRALVGYRYLYNTSVQLTEENLPLLETTDFRKIGEKIIKDSEQGNLSITDVWQIIEAQQPGEYTYGPSVIAGKPYVQDASGKRVYLKPSLKSEIPPFKVVVDAFPSGKPGSFNGAVGNFSFTQNLLSAPELRVSDRIDLQMIVSGTGQLDNLMAPDLCCQPGFSGFFKTSDLPTVGKIENNKKIFVVPLYPLTPYVKEIPSVEFSYFDPVKKVYKQDSCAAICHSSTS